LMGAMSWAVAHRVSKGDCQQDFKTVQNVWYRPYSKLAGKSVCACGWHVSLVCTRTSWCA